MSAGANRARTWAIVGGAVLLIGIVALIISAIAGRTDTADPTPPTTTSPAPPTVPTAGAGEFVDATVTKRGWVPEPITPDAETYIRAALAAASTFDTALSTREEWLTYLDTWLTPDTRYDESERAADLQSVKVELRQAIVIPQEQWDSLAEQNGRITAKVDGDISRQGVPADQTGDMTIGTADVVLTTTSSDGSSGELSFDETTRVSVQVLCGAGSIPTPGSAQQAGDCKIVRYFTEPLEP
ncbi:hypothetical protein [Microbacterium flavum]|uniref:Uncharacterized protein n=1 Tax=Microbacterium flavum TaxID=415216 RepID=A0ABS5XWY1_9MICO|nr:hypothetical protein [Microbacterium flavum]MBT8798456.1 hypothetical protein [Microbacterium flavum]